MIRRHPHLAREDYPIVISLALSLGMIMTAVLGLWLWTFLAEVGATVIAITSLAIP